MEDLKNFPVLGKLSIPKGKNKDPASEIISDLRIFVIRQVKKKLSVCQNNEYQQNLSHKTEDLITNLYRFKSFLYFNRELKQFCSNIYTIYESCSKDYQDCFQKIEIIIEENQQKIVAQKNILNKIDLQSIKDFIAPETSDEYKKVLLSGLSLGELIVTKAKLQEFHTANNELKYSELLIENALIQKEILPKPEVLSMIQETYRSICYSLEELEKFDAYIEYKIKSLSELTQDDLGNYESLSLNVKTIIERVLNYYLESCRTLQVIRNISQTLEKINNEFSTLKNLSIEQKMTISYEVELDKQTEVYKTVKFSYQGLLAHDQLKHFYKCINSLYTNEINFYKAIKSATVIEGMKKINLEGYGEQKVLEKATFHIDQPKLDKLNPGDYKKRKVTLEAEQVYLYHKNIIVSLKNDLLKPSNIQKTLEEIRSNYDEIVQKKDAEVNSQAEFLYSKLKNNAILAIESNPSISKDYFMAFLGALVMNINIIQESDYDKKSKVYSRSAITFPIFISTIANILKENHKIPQSKKQSDLEFILSVDKINLSDISKILTHIELVGSFKDSTGAQQTALTGVITEDYNASIYKTSISISEILLELKLNSENLLITKKLDHTSKCAQYLKQCSKNFNYKLNH